MTERQQIEAVLAEAREREARIIKEELQQFAEAVTKGTEETRQALEAQIRNLREQFVDGVKLKAERAAERFVPKFTRYDGSDDELQGSSDLPVVVEGGDGCSG